MDNGVEFDGGTHFGEAKIKDSRVEEKAETDLVREKDVSEEDEVFEEAVGEETPGPELVVSGPSEDDNIENNQNFGLPVRDDENMDSKRELDKFEEAIDASPEIPSATEDGIVNSDGFVNDKSTAVAEFSPEESIGVEVKEAEIDAVDVNGTDVAVKGAATETNNSRDSDEVNGISSEVPHEPEDGPKDYAIVEDSKLHGYIEEANADEQVKQGVGELKTEAIHQVVEGDASSQIELEPNGDFSHQDDETIEDEESSSFPDGVIHDIDHEGLDKTSTSYTSEILTNKVELINGSVDSVDRSTEESSEMHNLQLEYDGQVENQTAVLSDDPSANERLGASCEATSDSLVSVEEETATPSVEGAHSLENSERENIGDISSTLSVMTDGSSKGSQMQSGDADVEVCKGPNSEVDEKGLTEEEVQPTLRKEDEVRPTGRLEENVKLCGEGVDNNGPSLYMLNDQRVGNANDIKSSNCEPTKPVDAGTPSRGPAIDIPATTSGTSGTSASTPARPAGLGHAAPLLEPVTAVSSSVGQSATPARPAGLGRAAPLLEPAPRTVQQPRVNGASSAVQNQLVEDSSNGESDELDETREKLQMIRVKFLRLAHRLGQTPHNVVVAQVLYRLGLAEQLRGRNGSRVAAFSFDRASAMAEQLEAAGQEPLDFSCTIMILGKTGVGKSATINSIFDDVRFGTDAFKSGTKKVQDVVGTVHGIKVRVIDTPGLLPSWSDQRNNEKILHSVKRFIKKTPPDIVLYLDRLDMQSRDFGDMPLLRTITDIFGPSIWFNAIVVLTHAASAPPEGPNGTATSYEMFVTQRTHVIQQAIRQAAGDMRLMNPVSLVENHSACRTNRAGQRVLPNGQVWKPHLLLLSFASKILAEANKLLQLQDSPPGRPFRTRSPPLPFLLSSLLQSRPQVKLPSEQFGDDDLQDDDLDESSESDDESEYDQLPPFKPLTKAQLAELPKAQREAYYDEVEYREKLLMKKQLKEEKKRQKMMNRMEAEFRDSPAQSDGILEEESDVTGSVPIPLPDIALPASFDSDNPTHRYRSIDSSNPWLVRAVLEPNGWDHDVGYEGINVERVFVVKEKIPISLSGQVSKDKKDTNLQMELASSLKHGKGKATSFVLDMQSVGKDMAYTLRSETRFSNSRRNKAVAGLSLTVLGDVVTGGMKLEDRLIVNKQGQMVVSGGAVVSRGEVAYGGSLEATLRDKDHPIGRFLSTFGLSVMDWHGDLAIGCNSQTQIPVGRHTNLIGRVNINNRGSGQVSIRLNSSEQLQIALISLIPLAKKLLWYAQQVQFGQ